MNQAADDRELLAAAREALERTTMARGQASDAGPSQEQMSPRARPADIAQVYAEALADLDPDRPLSEVGYDTLWAGQLALQDEAQGWHGLAAAATSDHWRAEFTTEAAQAERAADGIRALRDRLFHPERVAEQEAER